MRNLLRALPLTFCLGCLYSAERPAPTAYEAPAPAADRPEDERQPETTGAVARPAEPPAKMPVAPAPDPAPAPTAGPIGRPMGAEGRSSRLASGSGRPAGGEGQAFGFGGLGTRGAGKGGGGVAYKRGEAHAARELSSGDFGARADARVQGATATAEDRLSTFAIDVDTAAYSIARRSLLASRLPEPSLVRVEELINYFRYEYDTPSGAPFAVEMEGARSPVDGDKHLLRVGVQARVVPDAERLPTNLVFLVDTSCSMTSHDKLELAKRSILIAAEHLGPKDHLAITTYAGGSSVVLPRTLATERAAIRAAVASLRPGGGTAMESGMTLAFGEAAAMLKPRSNTRVVVLSDGDANIGATSHTEILARVRAHVSEGVRLSTVGYGDGNYKDEMMEQLANKGNGNYFYVDSERMAERVFGRDLTKMVQDVAEDVKIQVDFVPGAVRAYRLVGYENREVADRDFRNDRVDAGEIGAGHQVTAIYELELTPEASGRLATVRVRSKRPLETTATESAREVSVAQVARPFEAASSSFRFATAVMGAAELMRHSPYAEGWSFDRVLSLSSDAEGPADPDRVEFLELMRRARDLGAQARR